jgi:hypothetical protein
MRLISSITLQNFDIAVLQACCEYLCEMMQSKAFCFTKYSSLIWLADVNVTRDVIFTEGGTVVST